MRRSAAVLAVLLVACPGSDGSPEGERGGVCEPRFEAPSGFEAGRVLREEYADHVGVHRAFRDGQGGSLHFFAGIPGEFGEGLPSGGEVELTEGRTGRLLGQGDQAWMVVWEEGGRCDPRVVVSNGLTREEFLDALVQAGIGAPDG